MHCNFTLKKLHEGYSLLSSVEYVEIFLSQAEDDEVEEGQGRCNTEQHQRVNSIRKITTVNV